MQEAPVRTRSDPLHARVGATGPDTICQKALTEPLARPPAHSLPTMLPGTRSVRPCLPPLPHTAPSGGPEFPPLFTAPLKLATAVGSQASRRRWRQWRRIRRARVVQGSGPRGPQVWRARHRRGFPCCWSLLFPACRRQCPREADRCSRRWHPSPQFRRGGIRITLHDACSDVHTRHGLPAHRIVQTTALWQRTASVACRNFHAPL